VQRESQVDLFLRSTQLAAWEAFMQPPTVKLSGLLAHRRDMSSLGIKLDSATQEMTTVPT
jgi:hypothetical protein